MEWSKSKCLSPGVTYYVLDCAFVVNKLFAYLVIIRYTCGATRVKNATQQQKVLKRIAARLVWAKYQDIINAVELRY